MVGKRQNQADDYHRYKTENHTAGDCNKKVPEIFNTILMHTGQNYDYNLNGVFFKDLGLAVPELYLDAVGADLG